MTRLDRDLDRALSGRSEPDEDLVGLVETARSLTQAFDLEPPPATRERALFAAAVGSRGRSGFPFFRVLAPVAAGLGLLAALGFASGTAMPGDVLYPVRKVLQDVGLNEGVLADALARMDQAETMLDEAEDLPSDRRGRITTLAVRAIQQLAPVDGLLEEADLSSEELTEHRSRLAALIDRGTSLIAANEDDEGSAEDDDRSGPGSGDDEHEGDDRSGSGDKEGDDDGDDDSDSDDDDDDDRSDDADDRDDDSGPGSDDADDRDDDSGPGSDDADDRNDEEEDRSGSDDDPIDSLNDELETDDEDKLD